MKGNSPGGQPSGPRFPSGCMHTARPLGKRASSVRKPLGHDMQGQLFLFQRLARPDAVPLMCMRRKERQLNRQGLGANRRVRGGGQGSGDIRLKSPLVCPFFSRDTRAGGVHNTVYDAYIL
jgi:hypothetical protein